MEQSSKRVLIVGAGGLGVPALMALAHDPIEELTLIDPDPIELSNLPRQVIYREDEVGVPKVTAAARYFSEIASSIRVKTFVLRLDTDNAAEFISRSGFVIDATDDPATKFLINDTCIVTGVPFAYGGVVGMNGQAMTVLPGRTACLRCLFEGPPDEEDAASCRDAGIIGPVAGVIGTAQAAEASRYLKGQAPELAGHILIYDGRLGRTRLIAVPQRSDCVCSANSKINTSTTGVQ
jgi:adenylyltransferase/sulfurtransferase